MSSSKPFESFKGLLRFGLWITRISISASSTFPSLGGCQQPNHLYTAKKESPRIYPTDKLLLFPVRFHLLARVASTASTALATCWQPTQKRRSEPLTQICVKPVQYSASIEHSSVVLLLQHQCGAIIVFFKPFLMKPTSFWNGAAPSVLHCGCVLTGMGFGGFWSAMKMAAPKLSEFLLSASLTEKFTF